MNRPEGLEWLDTFRTENIICPYCKYQDKDSWELEDSDDYQCPECGEEFYVEKVIDIKYTTSKRQD
jgi:DNA-directed RNA polymerase subunit RPC12/RpoP